MSGDWLLCSDAEWQVRRYRVAEQSDTARSPTSVKAGRKVPDLPRLPRKFVLQALYAVGVMRGQLR